MHLKKKLGVHGVSMNSWLKFQMHMVLFTHVILQEEIQNPSFGIKK
jgi:hypothetical protein